MKKYNALLIIVPAILLAAFCLPRYNTPASSPSVFTDTLQSPLVLYGSYIYGQQNCSRCHRLEDNAANTRLVSLDGIGKRYSDAWHYRHIKDPLSMVLQTKMPPFPELFVKKIDRAKLLELYLQQDKSHSSTDADRLYKKLQEESSRMAAGLRNEGINTANLQEREIVALIAYLQQIPASPLRRYKDSAWFAAIENQKAAWDRVLLGDSSRVLQYANSTNKDTIAMGEKLFKANCFICHGRDAGGGIGPNLTDEYWLHGGSSMEILQSIANGIPDNGMQAFKARFTPEEIGMLTAYIHSVKGTAPANPKMPQGKKASR